MNGLRVVRGVRVQVIEIACGAWCGSWRGSCGG